MDSRDIENYFRQHRKMLAVVFLMIGILSVSGFFMGMLQTERHAPRRFEAGSRSNTIPDDPHSAELPPAPKYGSIPESTWLANHEWKMSLADLPRFDGKANPAIADEAERRASVALRATRRAYDGAPPVVPHGIDTISSASCLSCHGKGGNLLVGNKRPAEISHPYVTNCTSCHVPADGLRQLTAPAAERLNVENHFVGKSSAGPGRRAYTKAPPTTPHPVWMRQNCLACHGPGREQAIRSSHPERKNCLQCHAPDAAFDNRESYPTNPQPPIDRSILLAR